MPQLQTAAGYYLPVPTPCCLWASLGLAGLPGASKGGAATGVSTSKLRSLEKPETGGRPSRTLISPESERAPAKAGSPLCYQAPRCQNARMACVKLFHGTRCTGRPALRNLQGCVQVGNRALLFHMYILRSAWTTR